MAILAFDTETTGLVDDRLPPDHPAQPHMVQLAAQLCDIEGAPLAGFSLIINPGVPIPQGASRVHGITDALAAEVGVSPKGALNLFLHLYARAQTAVAHNIGFDLAVVETACLRHGLPFFRKPTFCTMEAAAPLVNLPPTERMIAAGFNKPKAPKLAECVRHFFNEELVGAHDAMADVAACARVYFHLKRLQAAA